MSHVTHMNESCYTYERVVSLLYPKDICVVSLIHLLNCCITQIYFELLYHSYIFRFVNCCVTHISFELFESVVSLKNSTVLCHSYLPALMNHVKYLRAGPAEMPFRNWYTANTNHFHLTDSVRRK